MDVLGNQKEILEIKHAINEERLDGVINRVDRIEEGRSKKEG